MTIGFEGDKSPIGSNLTQPVRGQDAVVAEVVDLVLAGAGLAQDHVGADAGRRVRVQNRVREEERVDRSVNRISACVDELKTARARRSGKVASKRRVCEPRICTVIGI